MSSVARWQTYHQQMDRLRERRDRFAVRRLDLVLAATALALLGATAAFLVDKSLSFALLDRSADVAINALTVLAAGSLAALALARFREAGRLAGLYQASAFSLLAWVSLLNVAAVVLKVEDEFGLSLAKPGQLPLYISSITNLAAGALLVVEHRAIDGARQVVFGVFGRRANVDDLVKLGDLCYVRERLMNHIFTDRSAAIDFRWT